LPQSSRVQATRRRASSPGLLVLRAGNDSLPKRCWRRVCPRGDFRISQHLGTMGGNEKDVPLRANPALWQRGVFLKSCEPTGVLREPFNERLPVVRVHNVARYFHSGILSAHEKAPPVTGIVASRPQNQLLVARCLRLQCTS